MWAHLKRIHEKTSKLSTSIRLQAYFAYAKSPSDDMSTHISNVKQLALKLKAVVQEQTKEAVMAKLMTSLPSEYKMFKKAFEALDTTLQTKDGLVARLLIEETEILSGQLQEKVEIFNTESSAQRDHPITLDHGTKNDAKKSKKQRGIRLAIFARSLVIGHENPRTKAAFRSRTK